MCFNGKKIIVIIYLLIVSIFLSSCSFSRLKSSADPISKTTFALNTAVTISLYGDYDEDLIDRCFALCSEYELIFSRTDPESELYALNASRSMDVSDELLSLIKTGIYYGNLSGGAFDITIGTVSSMWDFLNDTPSLPDSSSLAEAASHVDYTKISIDGNTVTLLDPSATIDLGALAKGYIADRIKDFLISCGVEHAMIDLGGNILCVGGKSDGSDFTIGLRYPFEDVQSLIATIDVSNLSVVTSGIYERCFEIDGKLYHHILDPSTGYPYDNELAAVTIISPDSVTGDALSTVTFALGLDKGIDLINSIENVYAVFITKDMQLHFSDGLEQNFDMTMQ